MKKENIRENETEQKVQSSKMKIPKDVQKDMLEFFIHTSIPRKKAKENHLPTKESDR